jgi:hypothetical protein
MVTQVQVALSEAQDLIRNRRFEDAIVLLDGWPTRPRVGVLMGVTGDLSKRKQSFGNTS